MERNLRLLLALLLFNMACTQDKIDVLSELDIQLEAAINKASETNSLDHFILTDDSDYEQIPQESLNPLSPEKDEVLYPR